MVLQAAHVFGVAHSQNNKAVKREQLQILITFVNSQLGFHLPLFGCYQKKVIAGRKIFSHICIKKNLPTIMNSK